MYPWEWVSEIQSVKETAGLCKFLDFDQCMRVTHAAAVQLAALKAALDIQRRPKGSQEFVMCVRETML